MCDGGYTDYHCPTCGRTVPWAAVRAHDAIEHPEETR